LSNLGTACMVCNTRKGDAYVDELVGWDIRERADLDWDGLVPLYRPLWERVGRPKRGGGAHSEWLAAVDHARNGLAPPAAADSGKQ